MPRGDAASIVAKVRLAGLAVLALFVLGVLGAPPEARAQQDAPAAYGAETAAEQARRRDRLDEIEAFIADPDSPLREVEALREELRELRAQSVALVNRLEEPRASARRAIEALGPPPAADAPPEPEAVAARRAELEARAGEIESAARLADVNIATANRLLDEINDLRREGFLDRAFEARASALEPRTWVEVARGARDAAVFTIEAASSWIADRREAGALGYALAVLGVALALAIVISFPVRRVVTRRINALSANGRLGADARGVGAGLRALAHIAAAAGSAFILFAAAGSQGLLAEPLGAIAGGVLASIVFVGIADAVARAWYAPRMPAARLAEASDDKARLAWLHVLVLAVIAAAGWTIAAAGERLEGRAEARDAAAIVEGLVGALVLFLLSREIGRRPAAPQEGAEARHRPHIPWLRLALVLAAITAFGAAVGGYGAFARFVVERSALAVVGFIGFRVTRAFVHALVLGVIAPHVRAAPSAGDDTFAFWMRLVLDAALVVIAIPIAALIVGVEPADILEVIARASLGVRIGSFQLSLTSLAVGVAVFIGALIATRFAQRGLAESFLPRTRMDSGSRNSIVALVGYAGLIIGFLFAIAAAGFDLTNIAIIAGALSVGVGFGLQGFVNNFVSGLTLLFERPIKIGDWIVLPSGQGLVKKIGMRATEIETFDRATIIVPNAELVTGAVMNWTHKDRMGRASVAVGVGYDSDPELVLRLLLEVVTSHPEALKDPAPYVVWKDFGDSALIFEAGLHLRDVSRTVAVKTDLRLAIWRAFKQHGIEIPFPQRVVHMARSGPAEGEA